MAAVFVYGSRDHDGAKPFGRYRILMFVLAFLSFSLAANWTFQYEFERYSFHVEPPSGWVIAGIGAALGLGCVIEGVFLVLRRWLERGNG